MVSKDAVDSSRLARAFAIDGVSMYSNRCSATVAYPSVQKPGTSCFPLAGQLRGPLIRFGLFAFKLQILDTIADDFTKAAKILRTQEFAIVAQDVVVFK